MSTKRPVEDSESGKVSKYFRCGNNMQKRLSAAFYQQNCVPLARQLLGKILCRRLAERVLRGRIVETESYLGVTDGTSHSFGGRRTPRNAAMFMEPGTVYVYPIYGMYECMNISSLEEGSAVLIRALEPLAELDLMTANRSARRKDQGTGLKLRDLCNGPSKLCAAFSITKQEFNQQHFASSNTIWLEGLPLVG